MPATGTELKTLIYEIVWDDGDAVRKADAWDKKLKKSKKSWDLAGKAAKGFGKLVSAGLKKAYQATSKFVVGAIKNFANYEDILTHAARTLNLTKEEALELGNALTHMAAEALKGGVASEELARIAGVAGQLGVAREDVLQFTETVAMMGAAFGISADKAAEGMAILLNVFKLSGDEMARVGSAIATLGNSTAATAGQIINISQRMGAVAEFMGLSAEQTAAIAATLRDVGVSVNVAGTSMSQILSRIMSDYSKFSEVLSIDSASLRAALESNDPSKALFMVLEAINQINKQGGKIEATQALKDLGLTGVRVQNSMLLLAGSVKELRENMQLANEASAEGTALQELYQTSIDTAKGKWNAYKEALSRASKLIGGPLAKAFSEFLEDYITPVINAFADWMEKSPVFDKIMGESLPKALDVLGEHVKAVAKDFLDFLFGMDHDMESAGQSIDGLIIKAERWVTDTISGIGNMAQWLSGLIADYQRVKEVVSITWEITKNFIEELGKTAQNSPLAWLLIGIDKVSMAFSDLYENAKRFFEVVPAYVDAIVKSFKDDLAGAVGFVTNAFQKLGDLVVWNSALPDIIEATKDSTTVTDKYGEAVKSTSGHYEKIYTTGKNAFSNLKKEVSNSTAQFERSSEKLDAWNGSTTYAFQQSYEAIEQATRAQMALEDRTENATQTTQQLATQEEKLNKVYGQRYDEIEKATRTQMFLEEYAAEKAAMAQMALEDRTASAIQTTQQLATQEEKLNMVYERRNQIFEMTNQTMQKTGEALAALGGNISNESLQQMIDRPGMLSPEGLLNARDTLRERAAVEWDQQIANRRAAQQQQADSAAPPQSTSSGFGNTPLSVTLVMDDNEVGKFVTSIDKRKAENGRRGFGG